MPIDKRMVAAIAIAFVAGVLFGRFAWSGIFGYRNFEECVLKEYRGGPPMIARHYCYTLFPFPQE